LCIGCVARFGPQKALEHLLQAFALLAPKFPNARLVMVGSGPLEEDLHATAERLGIQERVSWPGHVDGLEAMPAFDVFALPSRYESFPYVLLEAMAAGIPVVMTQVGGAGSLIVDGVNGRVVPIGRPDLLASALVPMIGDPDLRRRMGKESRQRVKEFSLDETLRKTLDVYGTLMARGRPQIS
jgi:glycosyltransferase involved in cell wall biosynthesis